MRLTMSYKSSYGALRRCNGEIIIPGQKDLIQLSFFPLEITTDEWCNVIRRV